MHGERAVYPDLSGLGDLGFDDVVYTRLEYELKGLQPPDFAPPPSEQEFAEQRRWAEEAIDAILARLERRHRRSSDSDVR